MADEQPEASPPPATAPEPEPAVSPPAAWQPFTSRGVAAFAAVGANRLWLLQILVTLISAGVAVWFLSTAWFPQVRQAIRSLPDEGVIEGGRLRTTLPAITTLAEGPLLGLVVNLNDLQDAVAASDVRVEFHRDHWVAGTLFGARAFPYARGWTLQFNRAELEPWWGAWEPILLGLTAVGVAIVLPLVWAVLASLYCLFVRPAAYLLGRQATWAGGWRLCAAALMPGALLMNLALVFYGLGALDLIRLVIVAALHLVVPWFYLVFGTLALPSRPAPRAAVPAPNPFAASAAPPAAAPQPPTPESAASAESAFTPEI